MHILFQVIFFLMEKHENHLNFPKKHKKMPRKFREGFANISLYNYGLLYEKTVFCICVNKNADQLRKTAQLISAIVFAI